MTALIVLSSIFLYVFIGAIAATRHEIYANKKCSYSTAVCWSGRWCGHCCVSLWLVGPFWPLVIPIVLGILAGKSNKDNRIRKRQARELDEAKHQAKLAEFKEKEHLALDRELDLLERQRSLTVR